jgi:alkanesulfonate monooxygenase SsuD/methylene tetrahydromethanopterin reductase-like flavin-dependent oxidoreductase (luciferase family)
MTLMFRLNPRGAARVFAARGNREFLARRVRYAEAFRALWTQPAPACEGNFVCIRDVLFEPKPVQKPHPPNWTGGEGAAARRRAGRLGDGWYPTIRNPREPLDTPAAFSTALADVRRHAQAAGRDPLALDVAIFAPGYGLGAPQKGRNERGPRRRGAGWDGSDPVRRQWPS